MDLNHKYAAHQRALMRAAEVPGAASRQHYLEKAGAIATEISHYQHRLGAAAACAWSAARAAA